jgi:GGDEF domain-containing protein
LGDDVGAQLVAAFVVRLRNTLPIDAEIGRWGEEEFIALVSRATAAVSSSSVCQRIMESLPGPYGCMLDGTVVRPILEVNVCGVSSVFQEEEGHIEDRLEGFFARI